MAQSSAASAASSPVAAVVAAAKAATGKGAAVRKDLKLKFGTSNLKEVVATLKQEILEGTEIIKRSAEIFTYIGFDAEKMIIYMYARNLGFIDSELTSYCASNWTMVELCELSSESSRNTAAAALKRSKPKRGREAFLNDLAVMGGFIVRRGGAYSNQKGYSQEALEILEQWVDTYGIRRNGQAGTGVGLATHEPTFQRIGQIMALSIIKCLYEMNEPPKTPTAYPRFQSGTSMVEDKLLDCLQCPFAFAVVPKSWTLLHDSLVAWSVQFDKVINPGRPTPLQRLKDIARATRDNSVFTEEQKEDLMKHIGAQNEYYHPISYASSDMMDITKTKAYTSTVAQKDLYNGKSVVEMTNLFGTEMVTALFNNNVFKKEMLAGKEYLKAL